jgi:hypothetical protein
MPLINGTVREKKLNILLYENQNPCYGVSYHGSRELTVLCLGLRR